MPHPTDVTEPTFDGITYDPEQDQSRLGRQLAATLTVMQRNDRVNTTFGRGQWITLSELARQVADELDVHRVPEASVSARLRDLRKPRNGGWQVHRRRRTIHGGTWEYRLGQPGFYTEPEPADPMAHVIGGLTWLHTEHRALQVCPECGQQLATTTGITDLAYTFEVCRCGTPENGHLVQQLWHRACLASHDAHLIAHPTEERFQ